MSDRAYARSARIYDLLYTGIGLKDYGAEARQLRQLIEHECPQAQTLLDVACGTGAHLAEMRHWFVVEGVDSSEAMLEVARRRLPDVPVHHADMRTLDLGRQFDVVLCLFSSIGYVTDRDDLAATIKRLAAHVGDAGVLILDGWVRPDAWNDRFRREPDIASDDTNTVVRLAVSRRVGDVTELDMHHMVRSDSGVDYFVETHRLRLTPTDEYVSDVEAAGLEARVIPDYMPKRDRIVGVRKARSEVPREQSGSRR